MTLYPMKLVTIICESFARERVLAVLNDVGAQGYTLFPTEGAGSRGTRPGDIPEFTNLQIEVIVPQTVAESLLKRLEIEFFAKFALVVYESDIRVLRPQKF